MTVDQAPRISAVVPVYNVEDQLERCVDSLINQSLSFFEILLIDDGSTDSSGEICDFYARSNSNISVIHQKNGGLSAARNAGIALVKGDFITFVDSDDWISPVFNEALFQSLIDTSSDISICEHIRGNDDYVFPVDADPSEMILKEYSADEYLDIMLRFRDNRCVHYAWGKLYRKNVIEDDHFPIGLYNEDVEGCFKALLNSTRIVEVTYPSPLYCYYENESSITGKTFGKNYLDLFEVWQRIRAISAERAPSLLDKVEYNVIRTDFTVLCDMIIHGSGETDKEYSAVSACLSKRLRNNLKKLLGGPMPNGRKLLAICLAYGFNGAKAIFRTKQRISY